MLDKSYFKVAKNAAGYHLWLVTQSTADGAPLDFKLNVSPSRTSRAKSWNNKNLFFWVDLFINKYFAKRSKKWLFSMPQNKASGQFCVTADKTLCQVIRCLFPSKKTIIIYVGYWTIKLLFCLIKRQFRCQASSEGKDQIKIVFLRSIFKITVCLK